MNRILNSITISLLSFMILVGCYSQPTDIEIERQVKEYVLSDVEESYTFKNYEKINGIEVDDKTYIAIVNYDLVAMSGARKWRNYPYREVEFTFIKAEKGWMIRYKSRKLKKT